MNTSTTTQSLSAEMILENILNTKGGFVRVCWKSNPKPAAAFKSVTLEKRTSAVVRAGINFANLTSVKEAIAAGERGEVGELPWGQWYVDPNGKSWFPHLITHKGEMYVRLYPSNSEASNHKTSTIYLIEGKEVTKQEFAGCLTPSEGKKLLDPNGSMPDCFTIKEQNILSTEEVFDV